MVSGHAIRLVKQNGALEHAHQDNGPLVLLHTGYVTTMENGKGYHSQDQSGIVLVRIRMIKH